MSQEEQNPKVVIDNIDSLLVSTTAIPHDVSVDPENPDRIIRVWVKELSFLQIQEAIEEVVQLNADGEVNVDLAGYWKYMLKMCIERTEPKIGMAQMYALKPEVAAKITALLPQPQDLVVGPLEDGLDA